MTLPYPPSVNALYIPVARGRLVLSEAGRNYHEQAGWSTRFFYRGEPLTGDVALRLTFYRPRRTGDLSNLLKCLEDSFTGILYVDDAQIVEEHLFRLEDPARPRVEVALWEVERAAANQP